ncbi:MAG: dinitrogenase iron-molybdenum cofactor biosynthesis protein [Clostridiales bacterium]|jgi:predicted Fe-Mo cluster-binding NifX family protein|nr:dinitrogenase iron-molybdenum cofactor biosynthesis protein [Clostridiales bacterium]
MKIAIPVDNNDLNTTVCMSFGRTPYFLIYEIESKEHTFLDNGAAASQGGAGIKAAQVIADNQVDAVLVPRCGENAAEVFKAAGIKLYKTTGDLVKENIDAFMEGKLTLLEDIHPGFHNHGKK